MDVMTAFRNRHHLVSVTAVEVGSSLELTVYVTLSANAVLTFLPANDCHFNDSIRVHRCSVATIGGRLLLISNPN